MAEVLSEQEISALLSATDPDDDMRETILTKAKDAVDGPRNRDYGHPSENHGTTAAMFTAWLQRRYKLNLLTELDAIDVCAFNLFQKLSRLANSPDHIDSLVDIAGYARNWEMILSPEE